MKPNEPDMTPEALAEMIDRLMASGTEHLNLEIGEETHIQTVNTAACCKPGACAVPNLDLEDDEAEAEAETDEADF